LSPNFSAFSQDPNEVYLQTEIPDINDNSYADGYYSHVAFPQPCLRVVRELLVTIMITLFFDYQIVILSSELLRRLKTSSLSADDGDDINPSEETARNDLIRGRKTRCLIERKKQDSEANDSFTVPTNPLPLTTKLLSVTTFLRFRSSSWTWRIWWCAKIRAHPWRQGSFANSRRALSRTPLFTSTLSWGNAYN
jgi:hypothetical protein